MFIALPLLDASPGRDLVPVDLEFLLENIADHLLRVFAVVFKRPFQHQSTLLCHLHHDLVGQFRRERLTSGPLHALVWGIRIVLPHEKDFILRHRA